MKILQIFCPGVFSNERAVKSTPSKSKKTLFHRGLRLPHRHTYIALLCFTFLCFTLPSSADRRQPQHFPGELFGSFSSHIAVVLGCPVKDAVFFTTLEKEP
ncbi:MAG: hypothetical protein IKU11_06300 [Clostridia bacterium]|nr:hypothetical protein [Clostridia bacterium]